MKKSILTIGLFSLVMVLSSFTTETANPQQVENNNDIDGQSTGNVGGRKLDFYRESDKLISLDDQLDIDGQSTGNVGGRKID